MPILTVFLRKVFSFFCWMFSGLKTIVLIVLRRKRTSNIGELPFTIQKQQQQDYSNNSFGDIFKSRFQLFCPLGIFKEKYFFTTQFY